MSKTFYATGNLKHNGVAFAKGDVVEGLESEVAESLLASGAISTKAVETETPEVNPLLQSDAAKAEARKNKGQESQESKDEKRQPEVGGESSDSGEESIDGSEGDDSSDDDESSTKATYRVLESFEHPEGTKHEVDDVIELEEDEASDFTKGLFKKGFIVKIEGEDEGPGSQL